ncbi:uncharacterized protein PAC_02953 [Phialocephala subalpina]|uniref:Uncharacterized protein n=1 Tax=Phialocephala subalpina TaxID=576137 RepID=A0A1L7WJW9_9HELO|nr:uncharacterized protein PAC_02953 [Phialocephala subalpina]
MSKSKSVAIVTCTKKNVDEEKKGDEQQGQRLLGATSTYFYKAYRENYYENTIHYGNWVYRNVILISFEHDLDLEEYLSASSITPQYLDIMLKWLCRSWG